MQRRRRQSDNSQVVVRGTLRARREAECVGDRDGGACS
jgi:hypothetical protein